MLLYLVQSESSRILCCKVYKPIGVALEFKRRKRDKVRERVTDVACLAEAVLH